MSNPTNEQDQLRNNRGRQAAAPNRWLSLKGIDLTEVDKTRIISGKELSENHINFTQELLKAQFSHISGHQSTLVLAKYQKGPTYLQIIHSPGNHWIVATNLGCAPELQVFDSVLICWWSNNQAPYEPVWLQTMVSTQSQHVWHLLMTKSLGNSFRRTWELT